MHYPKNLTYEIISGISGSGDFHITLPPFDGKLITDYPSKWPGNYP